MKQFSLISLLFLSLLSGGCGTAKSALSHEAAEKDSFYESVRIVTHTEMVPVQVALVVPEIKELRRNVIDSVDVIENEWAVSKVVLHSDGTMDHGLEIKPRDEVQTFEVPVEVSDTSRLTATTHTLEAKDIITETVEVNVLEWWQKALVWCGVVALATLVIYILANLLPAKGTVLLTVIKRFLNIK